MATHFRPSQHSARLNRGQSASWTHSNSNYYLLSEPTELKVDDWGVGQMFNTTVFNGSYVAPGWTIDDVISILNAAPTTIPWYMTNQAAYTAALEKLKADAAAIKAGARAVERASSSTELLPAPAPVQPAPQVEPDDQEDPKPKIWEQVWFYPTIAGLIIVSSGVGFYLYKRRKARA